MRRNFTLAPSGAYGAAICRSSEGLAVERVVLESGAHREWALPGGAIGEAQPVGVGDQARADREPPALVEDALEPAEGERGVVHARTTPCVTSRSISTPIAT